MMNNVLKKPLNRTLLRNFLVISSVFLVIIITISLFMYSNTKNILANELKNTNYYIASSYAVLLDDFMGTMKKLSAVLSINEMVNFYITSPLSAVQIFEGMHKNIQTQIQLAAYTYDYVDSIYVVSIRDHSYISREGYYPLQQMKDISWLSALSKPELSTEPQIMIRSVNNIYPFVISIITQINSGEDAGYIVLNINIKKLPALSGNSTADSSNAYIVTDDSLVLYQSMKRELYSQIELFSELDSFNPSSETLSLIVEDAQKPYAYTQIRSKDYPWHYVIITYLQQYNDSLSTQRAILATFSCALLALFTAVAFLICLNADKPIRKLLGIINDPQGWMTTTDYTTTEVKQIAEQFIRYVQTNTELSTELQKQLNILSDTRLWALQSQINPHFIFNTLNHIHLECVKQMGYNNRVSEMIITFSNFIRYALYSDHLVSLSREIENTNLYVSILNRRYSDVFSCEISVPQHLLHVEVPKLTLQPLIENAIHHGADFELKKAIHVSVTATQKLISYQGEGDIPSMVITVADDGVGIELEKLTKLRQSINSKFDPGSTSIGLRNVATRLHLLYPENSQMMVDSAPNMGTKISLCFPYYDDFAKPFDLSGGGADGDHES